VPANGLIDTGAVIALVDRNDRWHRPCRAALVDLQLPLATSAAVLTELFHLVAADPREVAAAWTFLRSGAVTVLPIADDDMSALQGLMARYADRPMDFADATLVHLAEREGLSTVFTVDHADFETYRIGGRRRFRVLPGR
jgi:predicted nucleic acid-binding protein